MCILWTCFVHLCMLFSCIYSIARVKMLGHKVWVCSNLGLPWWLSSKESTCNAGGSIPGLGKIPWRRTWQLSQRQLNTAPTQHVQI